jgi:hypothetical protein
VRAQALKAGSSAREGASRLVGFASSNVEFVEHAFKQDTVGLQTKAQFAEKVRCGGCCGLLRARRECACACA